MKEKFEQLKQLKDSLKINEQYRDSCSKKAKSGKDHDEIRYALEEEARINCVINETKIKITKLQNELTEECYKIIKPYLESKGVDLTIYGPGDRICIWIENFEDKISFRYYYRHVKERVAYTPSETEYVDEMGRIVFNENGEVLIDLIEGCPEYFRSGEVGEAKFFITEGKTFIDDKHVIIPCTDQFTEGKVINLYKLVDGGYEFVHAFSVKDTSMQHKFIFNPELEYTPELLKNGLLVYNRQLFSLEKGRYIGDYRFDSIYAYDTPKVIGPYSYHNNEAHKGLKEKFSERLKGIMKKNDCLYGEWIIDVFYTDKRKTGNPVTVIHTPYFVFLDKEGKVVSDLFFELKDEIKRIKVTNENFAEVLCKEVPPIVLEEKEREETIKYKLAGRKKALEAKREAEMLAFIENAGSEEGFENKTMVYSSKPNKKKPRKEKND